MENRVPAVQGQAGSMYEYSIHAGVVARAAVHGVPEDCICGLSEGHETSGLELLVG